MIRVALMPPFDREFSGGSADLQVEAGTLFQLVRALDGKSPGFAGSVEQRAAFAVDGEVSSDWSAMLPVACEVTVFPRVAGG